MVKFGLSTKKNSCGNSIFIIAEMACSHEGNPDLAYKIIDGAGQADADAIQFQIWSLADMMVPYHPEYNKLKKIELSQQIWSALFDYVKDYYPNMHIIACVYEHSSVDFAEKKNVDAYKLHSSDLSNPYLIKHVAATGKRIDLSIGASTIDEIQAAIEIVKSISRSEIWLMYGYQDFPTRTDDVHLDYMMKIKELFSLPIGYQDHSDAGTDAAFWLPAAAVGMGVDILEKHITHDRMFKGIDHQAALNPDEFSRFCEMVREIETAKGIAIPKPFSKEERRYRKYSKKSIVTNKYLTAGNTIEEKDLLFMRADKLGLPPDQSYRVIGRKLKRDIADYHIIVDEDVL